eukprot:8491850-Karenia_brevis.AAC.1
MAVSCAGPAPAQDEKIPWAFHHHSFSADYAVVPHFQGYRKDASAVFDYMDTAESVWCSICKGAHAGI